MSFAQCSFLWQHVLLRTADDVHECGQAAGCGISHRLSDLEECKESHMHMCGGLAADARWHSTTLMMKQNTAFEGGISALTFGQTLQ